MTEFLQIARIHLQRYPLMQPQDFAKLAYQSEFGPEHMILDAQEAGRRIADEWQAVSASEALCNPEPIGSGLCRYHLTTDRFSPDAVQALTKLFVQSAQAHKGTKEGLEAKLAEIAALPIGGMAEFLTMYRQLGCPPVHHSEAFRKAYHPHYRVVLQPLAEAFLNNSNK